MNAEIQTLLSVAADAERPLSERVAAADRLAESAGPGLAAPLLRLLGRPRPAAAGAPINWDPLAAERVVDLHLVVALARSGDPSAPARVAELVRQAGHVLQGPEDERRHAADAVRALGRIDVLAALVDLTATAGGPAAANAVRTLQRLDLPGAPSGGPPPDWPELKRPQSYAFQRLSDELRMLAHLSQGRIELSPGTLALIRDHDYDRGGVQRSGVTLAEVLVHDIDPLELTHCRAGTHLDICTFAEAGAAWRRAWPALAARLRWDAVTRRWTDRV